MHATIDTWLTRFAAGAGSQYIWHLVGITNEHGRRERLLRANLAHGKVLCPLTAQATYEEGKIYQVAHWRMVGAPECFDAYCAGRVIALAADDDAAADPEVRARLLRICGLEQTAPCPRCLGTGTLQAINPEGGTSVEWQCPACEE